ncbi:acyl-CoA thioesterase [Parvibaculum sp.]|uniref:acyl-CoA thioesterase n=1 Tax=Parvibaculum sp. TaxID=2024848 RepID=UPI0025CD03CC|nr:acyl-CoA thioesterase [Parvibaculum sp.]
MKAIVTASVPFDVHFYDLDPMNIVWHGNYSKYFELGRVALLAKIGYGYNAMKASGYAWPVIDMHIRYYRTGRVSSSGKTASKLTI